jgi:hypothetical protein
MNTTRHLTDDHGIESRLAARLAGALTLQSQSLPHDISERLRFARERALASAREAQRAPAAATTTVGVTAGGAAVLGGFFVPWWQRAASVLPLVVLVAGLMLIQQWTVREQVLAAAEIDSQLLADALPPAAYSDPGFAEFLRSDPAP